MSPINLPGFRWMPGMLATANGVPGRISTHMDGGPVWTPDHYGCPDAMAHLSIVATDPATGGCLAVLLGVEVRLVHPSSPAAAARGVPWTDDLTHGFYPTLGEACAAVAVALGRWPG